MVRIATPVCALARKDMHNSVLFRGNEVTVGIRISALKRMVFNTVGKVRDVFLFWLQLTGRICIMKEKEVRL